MPGREGGLSQRGNLKDELVLPCGQGERHSQKRTSLCKDTEVGHHIPHSELYSGLV